MKQIFPFIHSVVSLIVSRPGGEQIPIFSPDDSSGDAVAPDLDEQLSKNE